MASPDLEGGRDVAEAGETHVNAGLSRSAAAVDLIFICATILVLHVAPRSWIYGLLRTEQSIAAPTVNVVLNLVVGAAIAVGLMLIRGSRIQSLGIRGSQVGAQVTAGLWATLSIHALTLSLFICEYVLPRLARLLSGRTTTESDQYQNEAEMASGGSVGATLVLLLVGAAGEELLFRGLLLRYLAYLTRDTWAAILVSSLVFAALHFPSGAQAMLVTLWMGLVLGSYFIRKGSLLTVVVAHCLFNVSQWWLSRLG